MMVALGTLVAGFAVVAMAFEAPFVAMVAGALAYWMFTLAGH
jgi:hypothetical protein